MAIDTTDPSYWLNWRFLVCAIGLLIAMVASAILIWKFEGFRKTRKTQQQEDDQQDTVGSVYLNDTWKTCSKSIHPGWLLGYRLTAFCLLLALLLADIVVNSGGIFYFYTEWTFALVTVYFGLASSFSVYGCLHCWKAVGGEGVNFHTQDPERGTYLPARADIYMSTTHGTLNSHEGPHDRKAAGFLGYAFQILYQMCAGAVALTDIVYWLIIYAFLTDKDYKLSFLVICMHSVNAVFFLGDLALNHLKFPFFRIAYFILWTCLFVIFQWIIHMCVSVGWPYPFLDLSAQYSPAWYLAVGLLHLPCYGLFSILVRAKQFCLTRSYAESCSTETR